MSGFPCPCCGHRTLLVPSPSWLTCAVCFWTDEAPLTPGDHHALFVAQRTFLATGACGPDWLPRVRAPGPGEERPADWAPIAGVTDPQAPTPRDSARVQLERLIMRAFADVSPVGRRTLRDACRAEGGCSDDPSLDWQDEDSHWHQIPAEALDWYGRQASVFLWGNLQSFRYYLPAYLRYTLRTRDDMITLPALDLALRPGTDPRSLEEVAALTLDQRVAVVAFLRFVLDHDGANAQAERALERIWGRVI